MKKILITGGEGRFACTLKNYFFGKIWEFRFFFVFYGLAHPLYLSFPNEIRGDGWVAGKGESLFY
jgi:hypothetical protein